MRHNLRASDTLHSGGSHPPVAGRHSARKSALAPLAILFALSLTSPALALTTTCIVSANCREQLILSTGRNIPYYRSRPLIQSDLIQRIVIVIHGNRRDAGRYYDRAVAAAGSVQLPGNLILLAPGFQTLGDGPAAGQHYWSSQGWKVGNKSLDSKRISSFAVMDELLARVCPIGPGLFPNLKTVVIIGHSAGAQFVNRYVAGGAGCPNPGVEVRYVVMNPSSYLYVDGRRRSVITGTFEPFSAGCKDYDDYKYGLRSLNSYMQGVGVDRIRMRLFTRPTYYLAGEKDTMADGSLDVGCEANRQGSNRLARYAIYREYTNLFESWTGAVFISIPGIGHDGGRMLASEAARRIMFR